MLMGKSKNEFWENLDSDQAFDLDVMLTWKTELLIFEN